jgi:hypothetical protein
MEHSMETFGTLILSIAFLILFAATSLRFGVDSRDSLSGRRGETAPGGIVWKAPTSAPKPLAAARDERRVAAAPADRDLTPSAA